MIANRKATGRAMSMPAGIGTGLAVSVVITLLGAATVSWLTANETLPQENIGYGSMLVLLASSLVGAWISASLIKHRRLMVCMISGLSYYLVLLCVTALFFGGQYRGMGVTALIILGGCGAVAVMGLAGKGTPGRHRRRVHTG